MKSNLWIHQLLGALFAFLLSVSAVGNLVTGYDLPVESFTKLFLWCGCFSILSALLLRLKHGNLIILALGLFFLPALWKDGALWAQLQTLCHTISIHYHAIYDWPIIGKALAGDLTQLFIALSAWTATTVCWVFCRKKTIVAAILPTTLPLILCLVTTDRVPDPIYLYLLLLGMSMLLITDWTRRRHPSQGSNLVLRMILPLAAALGLLFSLNPQENYINQAGKYQKEVMSWFQQLQNSTEAMGSNVSFEAAQSQKLNLLFVGPKRKSTRAVMRITATIDETLYLRGRDYDVYSGTGWEASRDRTESFPSGISPYGRITVNTYGTLDVLYIPYYASEVFQLTGGAYENTENIQQYTYELSDPTSSGSILQDGSYLNLPPETELWAAELAGQIMNMGAVSATVPDWVKAERIADYVRNSAVYDLSTPRMDSGYRDFARWFLEQSDQGYCVHFASAATVLLRAAGIPARYVEGYMVTCKSDQNVIVQAQDAHAWAEYFDSNDGVWHILEATPAEEETGEPSMPSTTIPPTQAEPGIQDPSPIPTESSSPDHPQRPSVPQESKNPNSPVILPGGSSAQPDTKEDFTFPDWIKNLSRFTLLLAVILLQSNLRKRWKAHKWNQGHPNTMTLTRWRQAGQMARLLKVTLPEELNQLAQKAKFSQHTITPDELEQFEAFRTELLHRVANAPWYTKLLLTLVYAFG